MIPGKLYTPPQIARLVGAGRAEALRVLSGCVVKGLVQQMRDGGRNVYRGLTEEETLCERERGTRSAFPQGTLQGYEAEHRRFQKLCMATRRPLLATSPTAPDLLPRRPGKAPTSRQRVSRQRRDSET